MAQAINIFNFLKEYNLLSNPVITELDKQKWSLDLSNIPIIDEIESVFHGIEMDELIFLKVIKPSLEPCPKPDELLLEWINSEWQRLSVVDVHYKDKISREKLDEDGEVSYIEEAFEDDINRITLYHKWILQRESWREVEIPREKGLNLYNKLFRLYSDMKKEAESVELIIGDGIINWQSDERLIDHPVLLQKVTLEFEPEKPMFVIKCEEIKTEIYSAMLRVLTSVNQKMLTDVMQDVEQQNYHLPEFENTHGLFHRLIHIIDEKGEFVEVISPTVHHAQIISSPVLFLRKRTLGYSAFLENIIAEINEKGETILPPFFDTMAGNHKEEQNYESIGDGWNHSGIDKDILLTLPANNEQLKIIKYLDRYGAVLVQGPPGTGKTHTIANLIGHLLSQGNSVLVTSHTEKALTVLKDKVYKDEGNKDLNLQSLCISLLSSKSQKNEMDEAINEIASKGTTLDLHEAEQRIHRLKKERDTLIEESQLKGTQLLEIRAMEYKDIVYDNKTITPIDAAKYIKAGENTLDIIPGTTTDDTIGFPLSEEELHFLYNSNKVVSLEEEALLVAKLPEFDSVWSDEQFERCVEDLNDFEIKKNSIKPSIDFHDILSLKDCESLINHAEQLKNEMNGFSEIQKYLLIKTIQDPVYPKLWDGVLTNFDQLYQEFENIKVIKFENDFTYDSSIVTNDNLAILQEVIDTGKEIPVNKLNALFKPKWNAIKNSINNDGNSIEKIEEYIAIQKIFAYEIDRKNHIKQINKLLAETTLQIDVEDPMFEMKGAQQKGNLQYAMNWFKEKWESFAENFGAFIVNNEQWKDMNMVNLSDPFHWLLDILNDIVLVELNYKINLIKLDEKTVALNQYIVFLETYQNQNVVLDSLITSVKKRNVEDYSSSYNRISSVLRKTAVLEKRQNIIKKINQWVPVWAMEIKNRKNIHGNSEPPKLIEAAWKWRQLVNQIERIDAYDPNKIQQEINQINERLLKNARLLAYESAWFEKIKTITPVEKQSLKAWKITMDQVGAGKGKKAPKLLEEAKKLMANCQSAIPVWIMPMNRVVEMFDPRKNKFDVVIIDEASQSDILSLAALYLGKKIIIVGDNEQVSPDSIGLKDNEIEALISMYLQDIPNKHLFNGKTSLYDLAAMSNFEPLMLEEHFRCLSEIISFSNMLAYNGRIKPLRDSAKVITKPPVVDYRVKDYVLDKSKVNKTEAYHICSLILSMVENPIYKNKTIGVISMHGSEQTYEIDRLLQIYLDPVDYENRRIQCGTPSQFQGDERDIIFISIVDIPNDNGGPLTVKREGGNNGRERKRYNVAASRAKDQMWVVHSLNPEIDLKPDDIRLRLIKHAQNPYIAAEDVRLELAESPFEEEVMKTLLNKGYHVIPQLKVGSYRIDMVIEDGDKRIAIECDGEKWHTQDDLPNDLKRQAILERLGWRFIRIRGSAYYRNPIDTITEVFEELEKNNIFPNYSQMNSESNEIDEKDQTIINGIKLRAAEIRREWNPDNIEIQGIDEATSPELKVNLLVATEVDIEKKDHFTKYDSTIKVNSINKTEQIIFPEFEEKDNQLSIDDIHEVMDEISSVNTKEKEEVDSDEFVYPIHKPEKLGVAETPTTPEKSALQTENSGSKPAFDFRSKNKGQRQVHKEELKPNVKKAPEKQTTKLVVEKPDSEKHRMKPMFDFRKK
ncbi:conserved protein of unknown function [Petrocella atlantisensis]|uniref:DNA helicase n=1 Tax=Petrocella atlantisensis TaxID=2173034 RepID=A0A3P7RWZ8_9FIRM|nr:AAA domain-containing protein [Petrocella atlantisensis]VDN47266.1 conserved protein of unknown function [Petrocella atlantisensis]